MPVPGPAVSFTDTGDAIREALGEEERQRMHLEGSADGHWHWMTFGQVRRRVF